MSLTRYFHTVRHLRPIQIYGRAWQQFYRPKPDFSPPPSLRKQEGNWIAPAGRQPMMLGPQRFRFLNQERELVWPWGWNDPAIHRLWLFNLHYFEDLVADDQAARSDWHQEWIEQWICDNARTLEGPAWIPYVVSLRITNWIKWALGGGTLSDRAVAILAMQARYLRQRIETHLLGNHLIANAKALVFAGLFFTGDEAGRWLNKGLQILADQLPEQILPDGGHYELSPMYQSLVLEDLLDLTNLLRVYPGAIGERHAMAPTQWLEKIAVMSRWLAAMTMPDGKIALFNDAAWGIAPSAAELSAYGQRLGFSAIPMPTDGITELRDSGYVRLQTGPAVAIVDVGEIGPRFLPGHGHADVLSFELSVFGQRAIVDSGTSVYYGNDAERLRQRKTEVHNTVSVDNQDSSEVWDNFRVARRAHPRDLVVDEQPDGGLLVACSHDGYRRLTGQVIHRRRWRLWADRLDVHDELSGVWQTAIARFHLAPEVHPTMTGGHVEMEFSGHKLLWLVDHAEIALKRSTYHPEFGVSVPNQCLTARMLARQASHQFGWSFS